MLVENYDCVLFDLDGTLYLGDLVLPGAPAAVTRVRQLGRRPVFMTNNSSRTPAAVAQHLRGLGIEADDGEVITSAMATAGILRARGARSAFVIGGEGLRSAVAGAGCRLVGQEESVPDVVVVGWDTQVTYSSLRAASVYVQRGAGFIASNPDRAFPAPDGSRWPGAGALAAVVEATTDVAPLVVGKPAAPLFEAALHAGGGGRPLVVGDRLDTDVAGAAALGWDCLLVLTGVTTQAPEPGPAGPTFVGETLGRLFDPA